MAISYKKKTASEWAESNPILALNEIAMESDTKKIKKGDGETSWNDLKYHGDTETVTFLGTVTTLTIW